MEQMPQSVGMERRQFLKWLGLAAVVTVVGAGAGLRAIGNALASSASEQQASAQPSGNEVVQTSPTPTAVPTQSAAASSCVVRCPNRCSYPGRCRRYVDSNGNSRCDWGECV